MNTFNHFFFQQFITFLQQGLLHAISRYSTHFYNSLDVYSSTLYRGP